jgi:hypothetical protein
VHEASKPLDVRAAQVAIPGLRAETVSGLNRALANLAVTRLRLRCCACRGFLQPPAFLQGAGMQGETREDGGAGAASVAAAATHRRSGKALPASGASSGQLPSASLYAQPAPHGVCPCYCHRVASYVQARLQPPAEAAYARSVPPPPLPPLGTGGLALAHPLHRWRAEANAEAAHQLDTLASHAAQPQPQLPTCTLPCTTANGSGRSAGSCRTIAWETPESSGVVPTDAGGQEVASGVPPPPPLAVQALAEILACCECGLPAPRHRQPQGPPPPSQCGTAAGPGDSQPQPQPQDQLSDTAAAEPALVSSRAPDRCDPARGAVEGGEAPTLPPLAACPSLLRFNHVTESGAVVDVVPAAACVGGQTPLPHPRVCGAAARKAAYSQAAPAEGLDESGASPLPMHGIMLLGAADLDAAAVLKVSAGRLGLRSVVPQAATNAASSEAPARPSLAVCVSCGALSAAQGGGGDCCSGGRAPDRASAASVPRWWHELLAAYVGPRSGTEHLPPRLKVGSTAMSMKVDVAAARLLL